jgi:adenylosuccinate synthase
MTKLDVLSDLPTLRVATSYRSREGAELNEFPYHQSILHNVTPEYVDLPGFEGDITGCRTQADLPAEALDYIRFISDFVGVPIALVGVGPGHDQNVWIDPA